MSKLCPKCKKGNMSQLIGWLKCVWCGHSIKTDIENLNFSRDVYVYGRYNDVSEGTKVIGGIRTGKVSDLLSDNETKDHLGYTIGEINGSKHFEWQILKSKFLNSDSSR